MNASFKKFIKTAMSYDVLLDGEREHATPEELFNSHMKMVVAIATKKYHRLTNFEDIMQVGMLALHEASNMYDSSRDVSFYSYAVHRVTHSMSNYTMLDYPIQTIKSKPQRKIFHNYTKYRTNTNENKYGLTMEQVGKMSIDLGVSIQDIRDVEQGLSLSYERSVSIDDDTSFEIPDNSRSPENIMMEHDEMNVSSKVVLNVMKTVLTDREIDIIKSRFLLDETKTLADLSIDYGVSIERIRQIVDASLKKLKKHLVTNGYTSDVVFSV